MSDKLEKCVCGVGLPFLEEVDISTAPPDVNDEVIKFYMECSWCSCRTSYCNTKSHAKEEWQTIQRSLKSGWSSDVPTVAGFYLVCTKWFAITCVEVDETLHFINDDELCDVSDWDADDTLWFRINYPDPPKD